MLKHLVLLIAVAGCGKGDKCERTFDKLASLKGDKHDRETSIRNCRADLEANPEREKMLDCLLSLEGEMTGAKLITCANVGKPKKSEPKAEPPASGY